MDGPRPTDAELLRAIAGADRVAFATFFQRYALRVKAFLMRWGTPPDQADELSQEVMVAVWRKAATYDPARASVATWIFTIARNRRIDLVRKGAHAVPDPDDPLFQPDPEPDAADRLSQAQRDAAVRAALALLPPDQMAVMRIAFYDGLSQSEIALRLDLPLGTVKSRMRLAMARLRTALGEPFREELLDD